MVYYAILYYLSILYMYNAPSPPQGGGTTNPGLFQYIMYKYIQIFNQESAYLIEFIDERRTEFRKSHVVVMDIK